MENHKGMDALYSIIADVVAEAMKAAASPASPADAKVVTITTSREAFAAQQAKLKNYDEMAAKLRIAEQNAEAAAALAGEREGCIDQLRSEVAELKATNKALSNRLATTNSQALHAELSRYHKKLTAAQNQRDSYKKTIEQHEKTIHELEAKIADLTKEQPKQVETLYIDGVAFTESDIRRILTVSNKRMARINELEAALQPTQMAEGDSAANTIAKNALPKSIHDKTVYEHRRLVNAGRDVILIQDPFNVTLRVKVFPSEQYLELNAGTIQQLVDDANSNKLAADKARADNIAKADTIKRQAADLKTAQARIDEIRKTLVERNSTLSALKISLATKEGELKQLKAAAETKGPKPSAAIRSTMEMEPGKAYMTTALGMLPVDSTGMRQLSDALDTYRAKVQSLTKGLTEWLKA